MPASPPSNTPADAAKPPQPQPETIKDTLISIMIAFTMAFVFRGFVIEAFVIPTGSMAPTLMGAHMPLRGANTGYTWPVGAYLNVPNDSASYETIQPAIVQVPQSRMQRTIDLQDPISGELIKAENRRCYSGDRILVLKYLYGLRDPSRFDVIVFKDPQNTANNFIKRLIGLPGEQIALADGDVFYRTAPEGREPPATGKDGPEARAALWEGAGWHIARKDPIVQRAVWQLVYDTSFAPLTTTADTTPWLGRDKDWSITPREYRYAGGGTTGLVFDQTRQRSSREIRGSRGMRWAIDDYYPYDEPYANFQDTADRFPVSDVRLRCGFRPEKDAETIAMLLDAREHEFRATIGSGTAKIEVRKPVGGPGLKGEWETVVTQTSAALPAGAYSNVEFWHVDQSVQIWLEGKQVAHYEYEWSPGERLRHVTGKSLGELMQQQARDPQGSNELAKKDLYRPCTVGFEFTGGAFTLTRIGLDRDLYYRPASKGGGISALGTSPYASLILGPDQFFACGDNSPQSLDGRLWETVDPWVQELYPPASDLNPRAGVIPRELLLGKAFFVYWPSVRWSGDPVLMPDFGRMRFIW
jgi:signal peptidase I